MSAVVVHSKPSCVQCVATIRKLTKEGITHTVVMLTDESLAGFKADGHMTAPVVVTSNGTWVGYQPAMIMALVEVAA